MATVIDFLGNVVMRDFEGESRETVTMGELVERAWASRAKCAWMEVAYHAVVSYVIAGIQRSPIRIRGSGRSPRDHEEWLWNVRPNPNQNHSDFVTRLLDGLFFGRHRGSALVVPHGGWIWIADGWTERREPGLPTRYEQVSIEGSTLVATRSYSADEVFVFRLPETSRWRALFSQMQAAYDEMAASAVDAFGDKNDRRYLLKVDRQQAGTAAQQGQVDEYLRSSVGPFIRGTDVALPIYRGFDLARMESDYSGGETTLDVVQIRQESFKVVATCLGIPYSFLEGNVNNFESVLNSVLTFCINPVAKVIEDEIFAKSIAQGEFRHGGSVLCDTTRIRHIDLIAEADKLEKLVGSAVASPNDLRVLTCQERSDAPGMDDHYMTLNHARLGEGGETNDRPGTDPARG